MSEECLPWVEVCRCRQYSDCQERAVVLEALGIDYRLIYAGDAYLLLVSARDAGKARAELAEYEAEGEGEEEPLPEDFLFVLSKGVGGVIGYWVVLLLVFSLAHHRAFAFDWWAIGKTHALLIRQGEWWRTVTALTLHVTLPHLLGNLVFGSLFGLFLAQEMGAGVAWFGILLAGALGNYLNAVVQAPYHTSVGASTAVFGALGLLVGQQWKRRSWRRQRSLRRWAPFIIGVVLLGYLGTGGEHTDVLAHIMGMVAGMVLGGVLRMGGVRAYLTEERQRLLTWLTPLIVVLAWFAAFFNA